MKENITKNLVNKILNGLPEGIVNQYTKVEIDDKTPYKIKVDSELVQIRDFSYILFKGEKGRRIYGFLTFYNV